MKNARTATLFCRTVMLSAPNAAEQRSNVNPAALPKVKQPAIAGRIAAAAKKTANAVNRRRRTCRPVRRCSLLTTERRKRAKRVLLPQLSRQSSLCSASARLLFTCSF